MNEIQTALFQKARDSLRAAQILKNEGLHGFAISRAYYTMFYITEALLLEKDLSFSSHAAVISAFGKYFARTQEVPAVFHRYLIDAQDMRTRGDYDIDENFTAEDVDEQISFAEAFIELAVSFFQV